MKYLIVSDIHGSLPRLEQVLRFYHQHNYDMLVILGDIINYGPRNSIPEGIDGIGIAERLNAMADQIVAVRGNCDSEVDQMLLHFPIMADYSLLVHQGLRIFLTHGHRYHPANSATLSIDALCYGHTHLWELYRDDKGTIVCNTGSITFPKGGNVPTFATLDEDGTFAIRNLEGEILKELTPDISPK